MRKADFENNVQQKMQELRFSPSDEVWKRVEAGIAEKRKRRPVLLWLTLGTVLIGGTIFWLSHSSSPYLANKNSQHPGHVIAEKQIENKKQDAGGSLNKKVD